jgi:DNA-binding winged helix-turn-helix (wHTH) protein/Tol biopolymer transport system component
VPVSPVEPVIRFGLFAFDLKAGQLARNGANLRLPQQPLQLLAILLERPGEILTRDELRQRLWPSDVFVDFDHGLNKSIQKLRDALGDSATSPRYIETIPRVGYRFIAPVRNGIPTPEPEPAPLPASPATTTVLPRQRNHWWILGASLGLVCILAAVFLFSRRGPAAVQYTQLTDFTESATTPALSPDGHILAFFRTGSTFMSADQIYVKMLPNGEATRLTNDGSVKYNLAFAPDGSQIAYTIVDGDKFSTYTVPVLGGEPRLLLRNAAGLTWLDPHHYLFSRLRSGLHLGVVTQADTGENLRDLYYPAHERAMAHYSYASPDRKQALVVEMGSDGGWTPCKLITLDGSAPPELIGPAGACSSAGWSPDGSWMYFIATLNSQSHLWRQRFPNGSPEQLTFGPAQEDGLAVEPDGRSLITAVGVEESAIWIHDAAGERSLSSEGDVVQGHSTPSFSADDQTLYYLLRHPSTGGGSELRRMVVASGKSEAILPGVSVNGYDISPDGKHVVYSTTAGGQSRLWLAPTDRTSPPAQIADSGTTPFFGPHGQIIFQGSEGNQSYIEKINSDGSGRARVSPYPALDIQSVSPGRRWLAGTISYPAGKTFVPTPVVLPLDGGPAMRTCVSICNVRWSSSGDALLIGVAFPSQTSPGRTLVIPAGPGESLPSLPPGGITLTTDPKTIAGAQWIDRAPQVPGKDLAHFAYVKYSEHRNLYRITLP